VHDEGRGQGTREETRREGKERAPTRGRREEGVCTSRIPKRELDDFGADIHLGDVIFEDRGGIHGVERLAAVGHEQACLTNRTVTHYPPPVATILER
jgi:hypothetical protein